VTDILDDLRAYLAGDNAVVFSPRRVNEMIAAFDRLRAELDAEREGPMMNGDTFALVALRDEVERLRAENKRLELQCRSLADSIGVYVGRVDDLTAELAAERERVETAKTQRNIYQKQAHASANERDTLRELLREMRSADLLLCVEVWRARIDAALAKGGGDE